MSNTDKRSHKNTQEKVGKDLNALPQDLGKVTTLGLLQLGSSLLLKEAIADEITKYLGREFYRHLKSDQEFKGERNGYRKTTLDTPIGQVEYERPLVVHAPDFESNYHKPYMRRPEQFSEAICDMYINGVSTRNVRGALKSVAGKKAKLSRSTISRITEKLKVEFNIWKNRDLSNLKVAYLIMDAIWMKMRMDSSPKQSVMIAHAVLEDGSFETIAIQVRTSESDLAWSQFVSGIKNRGLRDPLLVISDGNHGVIESIEKHFPTSWRQRCVKHKTENILSFIPKENHSGIKKDLHQIFHASSLEQAKSKVEDFKLKYRKNYPSAVECLERDLSQCLTYYYFPISHWKRIRTSNQLERLHLEIRRRLNAIGRHPSEEGCLSLIYHVTKKHVETTHSFRVDELITHLWKNLKERKKEMITQLELDLEAA